MTNHDERMARLRVYREHLDAGHTEQVLYGLISYLIGIELEAKQEAQRQAWADREREKEVGEQWK